ncbi:hypothetical protein V8E36_005980 [Tilletia maclaganii]
MPASAEPARCPLGFTGTPPPGHPSVPGLSTSSSENSKASGQGSAAAGPLAFFHNLATQPWSQTHTLLVLDALFILGATLIAIYWDRIPGLKNLKGPQRNSGAGAGAGAGGGGSDSKGSGAAGL